MGVDIREPRPVEHFVYFPSQEAAQKAVTECFQDVQSDGLTAEHNGEWSVTVTLHHKLQFADLAHYRCALIRDVLEPLGGYYDGWGAPIDD
jgi:hypothetical protein